VSGAFDFGSPQNQRLYPREHPDCFSRLPEFLVMSVPLTPVQRTGVEQFITRIWCDRRDERGARKPIATPSFRAARVQTKVCAQAD
jgi:hypothetical protein